MNRRSFIFDSKQNFCRDRGKEDNDKRRKSLVSIRGRKVEVYEKGRSSKSVDDKRVGNELDL